MIRSLYAAASGMHAQQLNIDVIANNLANVGTTGFKRSRTEFQELLYAQLRPAGFGGRPLGLQLGHGTQPGFTQRIMTGGSVLPTASPADLALTGPGLFRLRAQDGGEVFTRDGAFRQDALGRLVNSRGLVLLGEGGPVQLPDRVSEFAVDRAGLITAVLPGGTTAEVGRLNLALFSNPGGLTSLGENLFADSPASGPPELVRPGDAGAGEVRQRALEEANVEVVEEMVAMITAQRAYEINAKAVQSADDMLAMANNLRR